MCRAWARGESGSHSDPPAPLVTKIFGVVYNRVDGCLAGVITGFRAHGATRLSVSGPHLLGPPVTGRTLGSALFGTHVAPSLVSSGDL